METQPITICHQKEDDLTKEVEQYTVTAPSSTYFVLIIGAMAASLIFPIVGRGKWRNFIVQWIPAGLILYLYGKALNFEGSRQTTRRLRNERQRDL
jgi:hypothetical protein